VEPPRGIEPRTHALRMPRTLAPMCSPQLAAHCGNDTEALRAHLALQAPVVQATSQATKAVVDTIVDTESEPIRADADSHREPPAYKKR
jgi:hypothetical protein